MLTKNGIIKRTDASEFAHIRSTGIRAVRLHEDDELVFCALSTGKDQLLLPQRMGKAFALMKLKCARWAVKRLV